MDINEVYSSTLKAKDLGDDEPTLTIAGWKLREFDDQKKGKVQKIVLSFKEEPRGLVVNTTNAKRIAHMHGSQTDAWIGKKITLFVEDVDFGGTITPAIRVKLVKKAKPAVSEIEIEDTF